MSRAIESDVTTVKQLRSMAGSFRDMTSRGELVLARDTYASYTSDAAWKVLTATLKDAAGVMSAEADLISKKLLDLHNAPAKVTALELEVRQLKAALAAMEPTAPLVTMASVKKFDFFKAADELEAGCSMRLLIQYDDGGELTAVGDSTDPRVIWVSALNIGKALDAADPVLHYELFVTVQYDDGESVDLAPFLVGTN